MEFIKIEHYDDFGEIVCFWVEVTGLPEEIQKRAKRIAGNEYDENCFGMCIHYVKDKKECYVAVDEPGKNIHYIDIDGEKHWYKVSIPENLLSTVFNACKEEVANGLPDLDI